MDTHMEVMNVEMMENGQINVWLLIVMQDIYLITKQINAIQ